MATRLVRFPVPNVPGEWYLVEMDEADAAAAIATGKQIHAHKERQFLHSAAAVLPTLTLTGPLTFPAGVAAGTLVANIGNVPAGVTPTLTPNDGRLVVAGSAGAWTVVTGTTAATAGTIALSVSAAGATGAGASVVVSASTAPGTFTVYAGALSGVDFGAFTGTFGTLRAGDKPVSGDGYTTELARVSSGRGLVGSDF